MASHPGRRHTAYGQRRARAQTAEDWHRLGDHDIHQDASCRLCIEQSRPNPYPDRPYC